MNLKWKRITEIYEQPELYKEGTEAHDINQGQLGDCYFLTALGAAASAKSPQLIEARFYTKDLNSAGAILVSMFVNGREQWVLLDDYLPVNWTGKPAFVHSK